MNIGHYEHGKSIFMSHSDEKRLPNGFFWLPIGVIVFAIVTLFMFSFDSFSIVTSGFLILAALIIYMVSRPQNDVLIADINRSYHDFILTIRNRNKKIKEYIIPFDKVRSISFKHERRQFSEQDILSEKGKNLSIEMSMEVDFAKNTIIKGIIQIDGLDLREEMLDFAKRFAHILEMSCGHMVYNNPQKCAIKFFQKDIENLENKINIHDVSEHSNLETAYKANHVKKDEIIDNIVCEEWNEKKHSLTAKLVEYTAKSRLSLQYQHSKLGHFLLYMFFYVFISTCIFSLGNISLLIKRQSIHYPTFLVAMAIGIIFAILHYIYRVNSGYFQLVSWDFDLKNKRLKITHGLEDTLIDLKKIRHVTLYRVQTLHTRTTGRKEHHRTTTYYCYNGVVALSGEGIPEFFVGETGKLEKDMHKAYSDGLVYANIFVKALNVPLVFCERGGEIHNEEYYHEVFLK